MARETHGTAFAIGAALGGAAGALWGLLNAPRPTSPNGSGFADVLERAADRLVVSAADAEISARTWLARRDLQTPAASASWQSRPADALWAERRARLQGRRNARRYRFRRIR